MSNETRSEVLDIIEAEAKKRGIPPADLLRVAHLETGGTFNPNVKNGSGAKGLFQFTPTTAAHYGIAGNEFDARANTEAAATYYLDNRRAIVRQHSKNGLPYLSGSAEPNGVDLYLAHQQGSGGYESVQAAIANSKFSTSTTRKNIVGNFGTDLEKLTGHAREDFLDGGVGFFD